MKFIDLSLVPQRTELRHQPPAPSECEAGKSCVGGGYLGGSIGDGAADRRDPHALGVLGNPVEGERDSGLKPNTIPL